MATVSVRVPDDLKARMDAQETINWSAVIRDLIREELDEREERSLAAAVAKSERLSATVDPDEVADVDSAEVIREWRDRRHGPVR